MKITLCMIVKDEEKYIEECLKRAFQYIDDAVIVDTGSSDKTVDIIKNSNYAIKLIETEWENDFSKVRNLSLDYAKGDWIIILDADEFIEGNKEEIRGLVENAEYEGFYIPLYNLLDDNEIMYSSIYCKLFKNVGYRYKGAIHEQLNIDEKHIGQISETMCKIIHYGYLTENMKEKDKYARNIKIIENEISLNPKDAFLFYNLGVAQYNNEQYKLALSSFIKCQKLSDGVAEYHIDMTRRIAKTLYMLKRFRDCVTFISDLILETEFDNYVDLHYIKGVCSFELRNYEKAEEDFKQCIKLGDTNVYVSQKGLGSFKAKLMLARTYANQKRLFDSAMQYVETVLDKGNFNKEGLEEALRFFYDNKMYDLYCELKKILGIK